MTWGSMIIKKIHQKEYNNPEISKVKTTLKELVILLLVGHMAAYHSTGKQCSVVWGC